jgi:ABC-type Fe3+-hydroxamate transport system substrate-binding protein
MKKGSSLYGIIIAAVALLLIVDIGFGIAVGQMQAMNSSGAARDAMTTTNLQSSNSTQSRIIEHSAGVTEITGTPQRVVAAGWPWADIALSLGVEPIGVNSLSYWESLSTLPLPPNITNIGEDEPNLEVVSSLEPDLIVTTSGYYEVAYDELSAIAPTIELDYLPSPNNTSTESIDEATMKLADALNKHDEGMKLMQERDNKLIEAKSKLETAGVGGDRFVLLYTDSSEGIPSLTLIYNNSKSSQILTRMGLQNSQQEGIQNGFGQISLEALSALDGSDVHLLYTSPKGTDTFVNHFTDNPVWNNLDFVRDGRVHNIGNLYPWGGPMTDMELSDKVVQALTSGNMTTSSTATQQ